MSDDPQSLAPGWHPDPEDPTSVRHWDGQAWGSRAPAPAKPVSSWKMIRVVALGVLAAFAVAWFIWGVTGPSESDCALNDLDRQLAAAQGEPLPAKIARCP